jgi:hypothetical protein
MSYENTVLSHRNFRGANFSGPFANFDWSNIMDVIIEIADVQCPLPQRFIDRMYDPTPLNWYVRSHSAFSRLGHII